MQLGGILLSAVSKLLKRLLVHRSVQSPQRSEMVLFHHHDAQCGDWSAHRAWVVRVHGFRVAGGGCYRPDHFRETGPGDDRRQPSTQRLNPGTKFTERRRARTRPWADVRLPAGWNEPARSVRAKTIA